MTRQSAEQVKRDIAWLSVKKSFRANTGPWAPLCLRLVTRRWLHYIKRAESISRPWIICIVAGPCVAVIPLFIPLVVIARDFCPGSPLLFGCIWPILFYFCPRHYIDRLRRKDVDLATDPRIWIFGSRGGEIEFFSRHDSPREFFFHFINILFMSCMSIWNIIDTIYMSTMWN